MEHRYRYHRPGVQLEYYTLAESQSSPPPPGVQPPLVHDLFVVREKEPLAFAPGEPDLRGFIVQSSTGDPLGQIVGFLADEAAHTIPYLYVAMTEGRTVVVPSDQVTIFPDLHRVTLEGGLEALKGTPDARFAVSDAEPADHYWHRFRRRNAA